MITEMCKNCRKQTGRKNLLKRKFLCLILFRKAVDVESLD